MGITHIRDAAGNITAQVKGNVYNIPPDHKFYEQIRTALKLGNVDKFVELSDLGKGIASFISRNSNDEELVKVVDGIVYYKNNALHNGVTERILQFMEKNLPYQPIVHFLERLLNNPSRHSVEQLFRFLEHHNLPLTEDGCFLAYKRVADNWMDLHSGTFDNSVGQTLKMDRREVDDDFSRDCSYGFHVGAIEFVRGFGAGGHVVIVKVDPANAVAVPQYCTTKMRVCEYLVLEEIKDSGTCALSADLYATEGVVYTAIKPVVKTDPIVNVVVDDDDDDDQEDDDWYEDDECDDGGCDEDCDYEDEEYEDEDDDEDEDYTFEMFENWAETIGVPADMINRAYIRKLVEEKNPLELIRTLYAQCIEKGIVAAVENLEKKSYRGRLQDILSK